MDLVVRKYGGTSLGGVARIKAVAADIDGVVAGGHRVVVVVSAMGHTTDELIALARAVSATPTERELDLLLSTGEVVSATLLSLALHERGREAIALTGLQAGIRTTSAHSRARIAAIDPQRILRELERGRVVIVSGFQGVTEDLEVTTLGRGASDTTAVALAARLGAPRCEIYTDVAGVFTADPRVCQDARRLSDIAYEEMLELASYGARVMHSRAVELGQEYGVPILVSSAFAPSPGTLICGEPAMEISNRVRAVAHDKDVAKVTLRGVPDHPGLAAGVFGPLADADVSIDTIVQNASLDGLTDLTFTVSRADLPKAIRIAEEESRELGFRDIVTAGDLAKVSIVGTGMQNSPGYAARMFRALADASINIEMITTSEIRITCIVQESQASKAVNALHASFALSRAES